MLHVPPVTVVERLTVLPTQTDVGPLRVAFEVIVTVAVDAQPDGFVYVIAAVPAPVPV